VPAEDSGAHSKPLADPSQQAAPSAAGQTNKAQRESWREPHFSPHVSIPPTEWKILDYGYYSLAEPVPGGFSGYNQDGMLCNSAGQRYDPQAGVVWTVEEDEKQKEVYEKLGRLYLPGLIAGSPACDSYLADQNVKRALGDAQDFADLLDGRGVSSDRDDDARRAFSFIVTVCDEIGGDRNETLRKLRARVCRHHELDISYVSRLDLPTFARLLKEVTGRSTQSADSTHPEDELPSVSVSRQKARPSVDPTHQAGHLGTVTPAESSSEELRATRYIVRVWDFAVALPFAGIILLLSGHAAASDALFGWSFFCIAACWWRQVRD